MSTRTLKNRVGEKFTTNQGHLITIIEYFNPLNCTIQFEDGTVIKNKQFRYIKDGTVKKPINRTGEKHITNQGYEVEIIEWFNRKNCTIRFDSDYTVYNRTYSSILKGETEYPYHPTKYKIGYIGEGIHAKTVNHENTKTYQHWSDMFTRSYGELFQKKNPTYNGCSIDEKWWNFQIFGDWFVENYIEGFELDKDILVKGNKVYSPETCCFVPHEINSTFLRQKKSRGNLPIGVRKQGGKFTSYIRKNSTAICLGTFDTKEEAFNAYKIAKEDWIQYLANKWKDRITERTYQALINYKVEITD